MVVLNNLWERAIQFARSEFGRILLHTVLNYLHKTDQQQQQRQAARPTSLAARPCSNGSSKKGEKKEDAKDWRSG